VVSRLSDARDPNPVPPQDRRWSSAGRPDGGRGTGIR
jgi:hypothetical protein